MKFEREDGTTYQITDKMFTGYVDSNLAEIYDGDRVSVTDSYHAITNESGTVRYIESEAAFAVYFDKTDVFAKSNADGVNYNYANFFDVDTITKI